MHFAIRKFCDIDDIEDFKLANKLFQKLMYIYKNFLRSFIKK